MAHHKLGWVGTACAVACSLTLILRMGASADADVIVGAPGNSANTFPFVVYNGGMTSEYQQAYAAADFSGPITITGLSFFAAPQVGTVTIQGTYTISLGRVLINAQIAVPPFVQKTNSAVQKIPCDKLTELPC